MTPTPPPLSSHDRHALTQAVIEAERFDIAMPAVAEVSFAATAEPWLVAAALLELDGIRAVYRSGRARCSTHPLRLAGLRAERVLVTRSEPVRHLNAS